MATIIALPRLFTKKIAPQPGRVSRANLPTQFHKAAPRKPLTRTKWLWLASIALIGLNIALLGVHVLRANRYAVKGYELTELRQRVSVLAAENKKLSLELAEQTSITRVREAAELSQFVPITAAEYIKPPASQVTQR